MVVPVVKQTLKYPHEVGTVPVETLRIEVLAGPEPGAIVTTEDDALHIGSAESNQVVLDEPTVSRFHVELTRHPDGILVEDHSSTNGTFVGALRISRAIVPPGTELRLGRCRVLVTEGERASVPAFAGDTLGPLRGRTTAMRRLFAKVERAAQSDVSVLLVGESGTGKELIARALHERSKRADQPFVTVDCAALTPTLVASELFGHEKGAFTSADRRHEGAFERANGGTLFLDEIGELPEALQANLLGVLERRRFRRLGGRDEIEVDVRIVAATHRDLRAEVNAGNYRLDLYYRIAVVRLTVPPLRERPKDIPVLIEHFVRDATGDAPSQSLIPPDMMSQLVRHSWPGNVRELRNFVEATVAMGESPPLEADGDVEGEAAGLVMGPILQMPYKAARAAVLASFESEYLSHALERADGNVAQAARDCEMDRSYLWEVLRRRKLRGADDE